MTVICAYTDGSTVWLAGDSFIGDLSSKNKCKESKVYKVGNLGIGVCGTVRQELVLESLLRSIHPDQITEEWLKFGLPDQFQDALKARGATVERDGQSTLGECSYLFALNGKIFYMEEDFGVWEPKENIASIGAGRHFALGALSMVPKELAKDPLEYLNRSLKVACRLSPYVSKPFTHVIVESR